MKNNNEKQDHKSTIKLDEQLIKAYRNILSMILRELDFKIDEIKTEEDKQCMLSIILNDYMQNINSEREYDINDLREFNEGFIFLKERVIDPIINGNIDINLLKIINEHLANKDNCTKIFCNSNGNFHSYKPLLTNENCEKYAEILEKLIKLFNNNSCMEELKKTLETILFLIENSETNNDNDNEKKEISEENINNQEIKVIYKLLHKLVRENFNLSEFFIRNGIIKILINKITKHAKTMRNMIYDIILCLLKNFEQYNENEGYIYKNFERILPTDLIDNYGILILYEERPEILIIFFKIISLNNSSNISKIIQFIEQIFSKYENSPEKLSSLFDIMSSQIQINDENTYERLINIAGYPSLVVRSIPKEENENCDNNEINIYSDNEYNEEEDAQKIKTKKNENQKWPLFGERLIDGNIYREIYEYLTSNHNKSYECLLAILFPSEYRLLDDNITIKISKEKKKEILLDIIKSIFNEKNNYPLFKYLYLTPSRSLLYKNLYSEILAYLNIYNNANSPINLKEMKLKEAKYKEFLEKEINVVIDNAIKKDNNISDKNDYDDINDLYEGMFFKCHDKNMKLFTGFIADIIPGEVIREEIFGIAKISNFAMYRIHYYTKFYQIDELREKLLNPDKYNKVENDKKSLKLNESKSLKKSKSFTDLSKPKLLYIKETKENEQKEVDIDKEDNKEENNNYEKNEKEKELDNDEKTKNEEKKINGERHSYNRKSSSKIKNNSYKENEGIQREDEYSNSEINKELDKKENVEKYDILEKSENDFIYNIYNNEDSIFILEDKEKKDRNNVKNLLIRYIFSYEKGNDKKNFNANIRTQNSLKSQTKNNCFIMNKVNDSIEPCHITCFLNLQRFKDELKFVSSSDIIVRIGFQ